MIGAGTNQFKILTPQNNINVRGNLIPQVQPQNQLDGGRRAYSNLRGDQSQAQGPDNFNTNEIRAQTRGQQRTVSRPRQDRDDGGQFQTLDGQGAMRPQKLQVNTQQADLLQQRNMNTQGNKGAQHYQTIQQTQGMVYQNSAKIRQLSRESSPHVVRERNSDAKKGHPKSKESGFVDNFKTNICKEQAKRLIFSNSNAVLESDTAQRADNAKAVKTRNKNIEIVNTNHQLLVDHQITASNMIGSHHHTDGPSEYAVSE